MKQLAQVALLLFIIIPRPVLAVPWAGFAELRAGGSFNGVTSAYAALDLYREEDGTSRDLSLRGNLTKDRDGVAYGIYHTATDFESQPLFYSYDRYDTAYYTSTQNTFSYGAETGLGWKVSKYLRLEGGLRYDVLDYVNLPEDHTPGVCVAASVSGYTFTSVWAKTSVRYVVARNPSGELGTRSVESVSSLTWEHGIYGVGTEVRYFRTPLSSTTLVSLFVSITK